jgi:hypothetical protein
MSTRRLLQRQADPILNEETLSQEPLARTVANKQKRVIELVAEQCAAIASTTFSPCWNKLI